ncbi:FKBP-type peptidyl-prolyl cis-trans isomerase [Sphingorhabdus sp.]|jgi:FKBP-type peptidyl-prolyl cis-trans isomerase FkpA|uniref:FKBP-type peptidyl-prolyl cis-trans isomerase n=1 Tax=Sphingorhabdus sp. TaxID=1902408 RepID=UPI0037C88F9D
MSITAVPIQPIKKGSLTKYWAAIALVLAAGSGLAYWGTNDVRQEFGDVVTTPSGLRYKIIKTGEGPKPSDNDVVLVSYKGMLKNGTVFDQNPQAGFPVTGVVPGFSEGLKIMQRGGKYRLWIPAELGYGLEDQRNPQTGQVAIPGGSELTFDVELLEFKSRAEIEAMQKQMQEMQKQQGAAAGGQGGGEPQGLPPEIQQQIDAQMQAQQGQGPAQ